MDRIQEHPKNCQVCGIQMTRKRYNGHLEDMGAFSRRKYCSLSCANTRETLTKHGYSWRARKHLKGSCEACGYQKALQAHHIDQDKTNNEPENIQTLCKHCHDFWHTAAKRNGIQIAGRMPSLVGGKSSRTLDGLQTGFPIGFTNSRDWVTRKCRSKPQSRGES